MTRTTSTAVQRSLKARDLQLDLIIGTIEVACTTLLALIKILKGLKGK